MRRSVILLFSMFPFLLLGGIPHTDNSVLSSGVWWKLAVCQSGIHKITYQDLAEMNLDPDNLDPSGIRLFGNGSGMLSEGNNSFRYDDLREIPLKIIGGDDNKLQPGDYILFYGESADAWVYDYSTGITSHKKNLYSDSSYYYLTTGSTSGKRIETKESIDSIPNYYCQRFLDYLLYEKDSLSLIRSGKQWFGEEFSVKGNNYTFPYSFENIDPNSVLRIVINVVAKSSVVSKFFLSLNGQLKDSVLVDLTDPLSLNIFANSKKKIINLPNPPSSGQITINYNTPTPSSMGWMDYLELSCQRYLVFSGGQMLFRDPNTIGPNKLTEFFLKHSNPAVQIWDITSAGDVKQMIPVITDSTMKFRVVTDTLRQFVAFDSLNYHSVKILGPVANQNLHSLQPATMVIVTHPKFIEEAQRLATFHRDHNKIPVVIAKVTEIYNEFSCGQTDPTAIRDFVKMLYDRGTPENIPQYLLLFGDGSYDPKNRLKGNNNYIPTYQSNESLRPLGSYVTDDYFGIMGDQSGADANGKINIGIGRFPVSTIDEARIMVDKIIRYSTYNDTTYSEWRNIVTFIADDENNNLHLHQAEQLVSIVKSKYPVFNIHKIYLDAFKMVQTPAGPRLPEVNSEINKIVKSGTLILNYTGHGGEDGWSGEKVLTIADINKWDNALKLPVFVTATCEFSRFDNPERETGGEMVILHPNGGAIAIYTTTRLALATSNFKLDTSFFHNLLSLNGEPNPKMGDLIRISKNNNGNNGNVRNFVLLGDPVQSIAFPDQKVKTTFINQKEITIVPDTALGLSKVNVKGEITNEKGAQLDSFNGVIFPTVFDKPVLQKTIGNTSGSYPEEFEIQNSILFQGRSSVADGKFEFDFVVPKGISLQLGKGKISYYAKNGVTDASGYYNNLVMGGNDPNINPVNSGPAINLYLDSINFISGQRTGKNPKLLVFLNDPDGINAYNLGIGHEILATLDQDNTHPIGLNEYYQPTFDKFESGTIQYPFNDLPIGFHTLKVRAWDLYDNSSSHEIDFFVFDQPELRVSNLTNSPNPLNDFTLFSFRPNQKYGRMEVQIQIFTLAGELVKTLEEQFSENASDLITLPWNGTGDNNQHVPDGLYIYRLIAKGSNGLYTTASQKLIISR